MRCRTHLAKVARTRCAGGTLGGGRIAHALDGHRLVQQFGRRAHLARLPHLTRLHSSYVYVDSFTFLHKLHELIFLDIDMSACDMDELLQATEGGACRNLISLGLSDSQAKEDQIAAMLRLLTKLQHISLRYVSEVRSLSFLGDVPALADQLLTLHFIQVSAWQVPSGELREYVLPLKRLTDLRLEESITLGAPTFELLQQRPSPLLPALQCLVYKQPESEAKHADA
jgi:hypothetical protein